MMEANEMVNDVTLTELEQNIGTGEPEFAVPKNPEQNRKSRQSQKYAGQNQNPHQNQKDQQPIPPLARTSFCSSSASSVRAERIEELCHELDMHLSMQHTLVDTGTDTLKAVQDYFDFVKTDVLPPTKKGQTEQEDCINALARDIATLLGNKESIANLTTIVESPANTFDAGAHKQFMASMRAAHARIEAQADAYENEYFALQEEITVWKQRIADRKQLKQEAEERKRKAAEAEEAERKRKEAEEEEARKKAKEEEEKAAKLKRMKEKEAEEEAMRKKKKAEEEERMRKMALRKAAEDERKKKAEYEKKKRMTIAAANSRKQGSSPSVSSLNRKRREEEEKQRKNNKKRTTTKQKYAAFDSEEESSEETEEEEWSMKEEIVGKKRKEEDEEPRYKTPAKTGPIWRKQSIDAEDDQRLKTPVKTAKRPYAPPPAITPTSKAVKRPSYPPATPAAKRVAQSPTPTSNSQPKSQQQQKKQVKYDPQKERNNKTMDTDDNTDYYDDSFWNDD